MMESMDLKKAGNSQKYKITRLLEIRELMLALVIIVSCIIMTIVTPIFASPSNIMSILLGLSQEAIIAVAMTILLVSGGFDLSVGSVVAFTGVVTCMCIKAGIPVFFSVIIGLLSGAAIGLINGLIIAKWEINAFIVTLGMMTIVRGLVLILANGVTIIDLPESFTVLGQGKLFGIQLPIIFTIIAIVIGDILLRKARFFRQNYYIGGNEKAAMMTGIKVNKIKIFNYVMTGTMSAVAGILTASRLASASVNIGNGLEMNVITACIIGGASLSGGEGSVFGAFLGALLMGTLINVLNLLGVDMYWQNVFTGIILVGAVVLDNKVKKGKERLAI